MQVLTVKNEIDVVKDFMALAVLAEFDNFFFQAQSMTNTKEVVLKAEDSYSKLYTITRTTSPYADLKKEENKTIDDTLKLSQEVKIKAVSYDNRSDFLDILEAEFEERKKIFGEDLVYHLNFSEWIDAELVNIDKLFKDQREKEKFKKWMKWKKRNVTLYDAKKFQWIHVNPYAEGGLKFWCMRAIYKFVRLFHVSIWFYFAPYSVMFLSFMVPYLVNQTGNVPDIPENRILMSHFASYCPANCTWNDIQEVCYCPSDEQAYYVTEIAELKAEQTILRAESAAIQTKSAEYDAKQADFDAKQAESAAEIAALRAESAAEIANLRAEVDALISLVRRRDENPSVP